MPLSAPRPLVETGWLAERLDDPDLRLVDARWRGDGSGRALYDLGHVPGAIHLDWHADLNARQGRVDDLILPPEEFGRLMGGVGIGDEHLVVAYADMDYSGAARLWWALRTYGHERAAVLNGGFTKWTAERRPTTTQPGRYPPATFTPRPQAGWLATAEEIAAGLADGDRGPILMDTRPPEQYAGRAVWTPAGSLPLPADREWWPVAGALMRAGRLPGALHLESSRNLDPAHHWTFLEPAAIRTQAEAAGIRPGRRVIAYCGVGISASLGLFALRLAGYPDVALYDGSWAEWGTDPERPIERDA
jgi:thiosulfate/3-mercaptopyruvate sulfurtransferase